MLGTIFILLFLGQLSFLSITADNEENAYLPSVIFKTVKLVCIPNAKYIRNATCKLKAINREKALTTMECDIVKPIRTCYIHFQVFKRNYANIYSPFLVNVTSNACHLLDKKIFSYYTTVVRKILGEVSNVNHSCPYTGRLIVKDLYLGQKYLPTNFPLGMYKVVFRFFSNEMPNDDIGTVEMYIQVIVKSNRKD